MKVSLLGMMGEANEPGGLVLLLWRRRWFIVLGSLACSMLATYVALSLPTRYAANGLLIVETTYASNGSNNGEVSNRLTLSDILRSPRLLDNVADQLSLARQPRLIPHYRFSPTLMKAATAAKSGLRDLFVSQTSAPLADADTLGSTGAATLYLQSHLTIGDKDNSRVLKVDFTAGDPELTAAVVNELMRQFIAYNLAVRQEDADRNYLQLMDRANKVRKEAAEADLRVQQFQSQNNVLTLQAGAPAALQFNAQQANLAAAKLELSQAEAALGSSRQSSGSLSSPALQLLGDREIEILQRIARAGATGSLNPARSALNDELRAVRAQISDETRKVLALHAMNVDVARNRVSSLQVAVNESQIDASRSANAQLVLTQLSREADSKHGLYQSLVARAEDARVAASQTSARILSPAASPREPEPSRAPMLIVLGFISGTLLTSTYVLVRSLFWGKIASAKSLAVVTGMPGLGSLPYFRRSRRLHVSDMAIIDGQSPLAETLRGMRLAIQNRTPDCSGAVILITSAEAGEGKTTVAAALARRASGDGLRVLLVEADLRRPRLGQMLGLAASPTLESGLLNNATLDALIQVDLRSGLHCVAALGGQPNPVLLLGSERFNAMMAAARASYDLVIVDSPPVLRVSDPILLARWADTIVFAVHAENTSQTMVMEALSRFPAQSQSRVVTLLTRAPITRHDRQGYFSGYETGNPKTVCNDAPLPAMNTSLAVLSKGTTPLVDRPGQMH